MSIIEIKRLLERLGVAVPIYPLAFPEGAGGAVNALMIDTGSGVPRAGEIQEFILTVTARGKHP